MTDTCIAQHKERGLVNSQTTALRYLRAHVAGAVQVEFSSPIA